jgi:hypothetical protein
VRASVRYLALAFAPVLGFVIAGCGDDQDFPPPPDDPALESALLTPADLGDGWELRSERGESHVLFGCREERTNLPVASALASLLNPADELGHSATHLLVSFEGDQVDEAWEEAVDLQFECDNEELDFAALGDESSAFEGTVIDLDVPSTNVLIKEQSVIIELGFVNVSQSEIERLAALAVDRVEEILEAQTP